MSDLVPILDILAYGMIGAAVLALLERLVPVVPSYGLFIFLGGALAQRPIDLPLLIVVGGFITLVYGLHAVGWNPFVATICAVAVLLVVEGGLVWLVKRRRRLG